MLYSLPCFPACKCQPPASIHPHESFCWLTSVLHYRPVRVVHSTLGTRVLLNLRTVAARSTELPQLDFATVNSLTFDRFAFGDDLGYTVDESAGAEEERGTSYRDCGRIDIIEAASPHPVSSREMNV